MKLSAREAAGFFGKPDAGAAGVLIFGEDAMRVALRRQELVAALIGPEGEAEMRLTRLAAADVRRDPAALQDAMRAQGFFPGARVVLVEDAGDGLAPLMKDALTEWRPGDAILVVTAGVLAAKSALRKLFEGGKTTYAAALYNDPPGRAEIETELRRAGLPLPPGEAMAALESLARGLGPGDFRQLVEKTALYKHGDDTPLSVADIEANAPASTEAAIDEVLDVLAEGRTGDIAPVMRRLWDQGTNPVTLLIFAMRKFRSLYTLVSVGGGPAQAVNRLRPPVFGPRRDRLVRQAGTWRADRLEDALTILMDTDLALRSAGQKAPAEALVERAFVRLAYLARR